MTPPRQSRGRRPRGGVRLLVALGLVGACLVASLAPSPFLLDRQAVADGHVWRLVTGHLVHASRAHFLLDVTVGVVLVTVLRWRRALWLLPAFVGILVLALRPDLDYYTGLSGVLHGWTVLAAVDLARGGDRLEGGLAAGVLLGVLIKALVESSLGTSIFTESFDMGGPTVFLAHAAGVLGGLLIAATEAWRPPRNASLPRRAQPRAPSIPRLPSAPSVHGILCGPSADRRRGRRAYQAMANSLFEEILGMLGQSDVDEIAKETGATREQTEAATGAAVGALLKGLEQNSRDQNAAEEMIKALRRDHAQFNPAEVKVVTKQLNQEEATKMLRHIFGEKQAKVERQLGNASGVGQDGMSKILKSLAPVVLGMLAKRGADSNVQSGPDLSKWLGQEQRQLHEKKKELGFLDSLLDRDHDGDVDISDMAGMIGKMLGGGR